MAIVTFWNGTKGESGTTFGAIAFAVQSAIQHNMKILLISTSFNNPTIKECFWKEESKKFFTGNKRTITNNGIEGLELLMRGGKISPNRITEYTKVLLRDRLEILDGVESSEEEEEDKRKLYDNIKEKYSQIIALAGEYYNLVIVDLDKELGQEIQNDIFKVSDIIVPVVTQKAKDVQKIRELIAKGDILKEENTVIALGKYVEDTKYNARNISRAILKTKDIVNVIPYSTLFFESAQEGRVIDMFFSFMKIKDRDTNYRFVHELNRLFDVAKGKSDMLKMKKM